MKAHIAGFVSIKSSDGARIVTVCAVVGMCSETALGEGPFSVCVQM